jgi:YHS domain-containing protein
VIKFLVIAILVLLIARTFWRVVDGIIDGARERGRGARPSPMKLVRDPVCGTFVAPNTALSLTDGGTTHYFCSDECRTKYRAA